MSGRHEVIIDKKAQRQLRKLPLAVTEKLKPAILALADNPRPDGVVKLRGRGKQEPQWRIRVGDYRIVYEIRDDVLLVTVVEVDDRRNIYR